MSFSMDPVRALIDAAAALDPPVYISMDPQEVNPPGGWLAVDELPRINLAGDVRLDCFLYLIAPDTDPERSLETLVPLYQQLLTILTPDGTPQTIGVVLPDSGTPLPAIRIPVNLY